ncbi:MAG: PolC-type DNA polymerase III [Bacillota bacterium]
MKKTLYDYKRLIIFDLETTGLNYNNEEIIDFGAIEVRLNPQGFQVTNDFNLLIKASKALSTKITELTNITDEMLITSGIKSEDLPPIIKQLFDKDTLVVAYNIQFDLSFIIATMKRVDPNFEFTSDILDLMAVYKDRHDYPHRLENAAKTYNIVNVNAHRAYDDAVATFELLKQLEKEAPLSDYINCIGYHEKYGLQGVRLPYVNYFVHPYKKGSLKVQIDNLK